MIDPALLALSIIGQGVIVPGLASPSFSTMLGRTPVRFFTEFDRLGQFFHGAMDAVRAPSVAFTAGKVGKALPNSYCITEYDHNRTVMKSREVTSILNKRGGTG